MCDDDLMTGTDTLALDGSRTVASSLEQNGHTYVETRITGSAGLFSCTWKSISEAHTPTEAKRILPDLCADFIVDSTGKSWLVGPATGADLVSVAAGTTMWGIRINPPALRSLLGTAADAVQDSKIAFDDILTSRQARVLADRPAPRGSRRSPTGPVVARTGTRPRNRAWLLRAHLLPFDADTRDCCRPRSFRTSFSTLDHVVGRAVPQADSEGTTHAECTSSQPRRRSVVVVTGRSRRLRRPSSPRARYACTGRSDTDSATARAPVTMSEELFAALDHLAATSAVVIDRPRGSAHPRYPDAIYPLDYGYLDDTVSADGGGIDLFRGSAVGNGVVAAAVIADIVKKDVEVKILLECTAPEIDTATLFLRDVLGLGATVLRRAVS